MVRTTIHVMRHGEVDNPQGVLYGRMPGYHLTPRGHAMAQMVADYLVETGKDITVVTTSPLERAVESGAPTAAAFGINAGTDARLLEAENHFEGVAVNRNRWVLAPPRTLGLLHQPATPLLG